MMFGEQQDFAMRNAGFTLVELLVALAIMAVVSAIALPLYTQYIPSFQTAPSTSAR